MHAKISCKFFWLPVCFVLCCFLYLFYYESKIYKMKSKIGKYLSNSLSTYLQKCNKMELFILTDMPQIVINTMPWSVFSVPPLLMFSKGDVPGCSPLGRGVQSSPWGACPLVYHHKSLCIAILNSFFKEKKPVSNRYN